jgi:hypothetical protein
MNTYRLNDGDTLALSVDGGDWETISFNAAEFGDIREATAEEIAKIIDRSTSVTATVNEGGALELATRTPGSQAHLEIDLAASSAAAALGLSTAQIEARGTGLSAARLVSRNTAPFALPLGAAMKLEVGGASHEIKFAGGITADKASAAEVADVVNADHPSIAHATRDARVVLTSPTIGFGSSLRVFPGEEATDAAAILGFVGTAAVSRPHEASPARIVCSGRRHAGGQSDRRSHRAAPFIWPDAAACAGGPANACRRGGVRPAAAPRGARPSATHAG